MYVEFALYDIASNETELKDSLASLARYKIDTVSVLPYYLRIAKNYLSNSTKISIPIDYPLGLLDLKTRLVAIDNAIKSGAQVIDLVCPSLLLSNKKYDKFREDIKTVFDLCSQSNVELRYFLEYRVYTYELLYKLAQILKDHGIKTILPSTGYLLDDIHDNILATALINKKVPDINIISNGNIWNSKHIETLKKTNLYGLRVNSINSLKLLTDQNI